MITDEEPVDTPEVPEIIGAKMGRNAFFKRAYSALDKIRKTGFTSAYKKARKDPTQ
jgi:hypothetical protein